jgi:uncharacterized protein (DUF924 family)
MIGSRAAKSGSDRPRYRSSIVAPIASSQDAASPPDVLAFWRAAGYAKWFGKDDAFDAVIRARFLPTYEAAAAGQLSGWEESAEGALALAIVLDQFSRNMFRGDAQTYAADPIARAVVKRAIARGFDNVIPKEVRSFMYLPLMHSETLADQEQSLALYRAEGDPENMKYAEHHADIIRRFGRFPHRNAILGRPTTPEEQVFLDGGGFKG